MNLTFAIALNYANLKSRQQESFCFVLGNKVGRMRSIVQIVSGLKFKTLWLFIIGREIELFRELSTSATEKSSQ